jgi:translation elongation factor EF-Tu-like GTPase
LTRLLRNNMFFYCGIFTNLKSEIVEVLNILATVGLLGQRFALREGGRTVDAGFVSIVIG